MKPTRGELALCAILLLFAALFTLRTDDLFWLRQAGEDILREHALPRTNRYSFTAPDFPWQTHEWLSEVLLARAPDGLVFAGSLLLCWVPVALVLRASSSWPSIAAACVVALETGVAGTFARPYLAGRALLAWLAGADEPPPWWLAFAAFALWVNLHGSFGYGLFVLALRAAFDRRFAKPLGAAALGALANPYGVPGFLFPLRYLGRRGFLAHVIEWQPIGAAWPWLLLAALPGLVAVARSRKAGDALLLAPFVALTLGARRGLPDLAIVSALLFARRARAGIDLAADRNFAAHTNPAAGTNLAAHTNLTKDTNFTKDTNRATNTNLAIPAEPPARAAARLPWLLVPLCALALPPFGYARFLEGQQRARPPGLEAYLAAHPEPRLFNFYDWGGGLLALWPQTRIFIDARNDCYPQEVIDDAFHATPATLDKWNVSAAALRPDDPLAEDLRARGWRTAFEDKAAVLLSRASR